MNGLAKYCSGFVLFCSGLVACNTERAPRQVEPAFYYWKSVWHLDAFEEQRLKELQVSTLYLKCFDVDWNPATSQAIPVAKLQQTGYHLPAGITVIPVVFITNECLARMDTGRIEPLAAAISTLVQQLYASLGLPDSCKELQIDCDWTTGTREKYFTLLRSIRNHVQLPISATIRLHQVKFTASSGIPPADRGLLMCYNMGNLKNPAVTNSIIDPKELNRYTEKLAGYPLPLDIALPLFEWKVLFRKNEYQGLVKELPDSLLSNAITTKEHNRYTFLKDTLLAGYAFFKGDQLRCEESSYPVVLATAQLVSRRLKNTRLRVSLYHLDSLLLKKFPLHELENIYHSLR